MVSLTTYPTPIVEATALFPQLLETFFLVFLCYHVLHIFINQNGPRRRVLVVGTQVFAFVAKIEKGAPLIKGNSWIRIFLLKERAKGCQSIVMDTSLQNHIHQGNHHFLVQCFMCAVQIETKAKLGVACIVSVFFGSWPHFS